MKQTFKEQLSMWRTSNGVATMKEVLENNTSIVKMGGEEVEIIRPHAFIKTDNIKVLGVYVKYKLELMRLVERMKELLGKDKFDEAEKTKGGITKLTAKFFNAIREATGYENVMAINHANALSVEDGVKALTIHLFPLRSNGKSYDFQIVTFNNNDDGTKLELPCVIAPHKRKKGKK